MNVNECYRHLQQIGHEYSDIDYFVFIVKDKSDSEKVASYYNFQGGTCGCCCELDVNNCEVVRVYNGLTLEIIFTV